MNKKKIFNNNQILNILSFAIIFLPVLLISGPLLTDISVSILAISFFFFYKKKKIYTKFIFYFIFYFLSSFIAWFIFRRA